MNTTSNFVSIRPARRVRLIEHGGTVVPYTEPHRTPVLPSGWAPLSRDQQEAVLHACDLAPECLIFRLGSLWEPECEYRVYRLAKEQWAGLSVVSKFSSSDASRPDHRRSACNGQLLGLAWEPLAALRIASDFFNWDLEAHGLDWRLSINAAHVEQS